MKEHSLDFWRKNEALPRLQMDNRRCALTLQRHIQNEADPTLRSCVLQDFEGQFYPRCPEESCSVGQQLDHQPRRSIWSRARCRDTGIENRCYGHQARQPKITLPVASKHSGSTWCTQSTIRGRNSSRRGEDGDVKAMMLISLGTAVTAYETNH